MLIKHLLNNYTAKTSQEPSASLQSKEDPHVYMDILFNLLVPSKEFAEIENMNDFVELIQNNFMKIIDV